MMQTSQFTVTATGPDKQNIEKLGAVVNEAITSISVASDLSTMEVLNLLEKVHVEMVSELKGAVETLEDRGELKRVDPEKLSKAIEKAIDAISNATDLDTDQITEIFAAQPDASVDNIVHRLRVKGAANRFWHT